MFINSISIYFITTSFYISLLLTYLNSYLNDILKVHIISEILIIYLFAKIVPLNFIIINLITYKIQLFYPNLITLITLQIL